MLGFVVKSAVMGKSGDSDGDTIEDPTSTFEYDLFAWHDNQQPNWAKTRMRETHQDEETRWLEQRSYFSGAGGVIMVKVQARPGLAPERDINGELVFIDDVLQYADTSPDVRWVGNGRVVKDNKGNVIKAYEPYYSSTPEYEDEAELVEQGVTALNHYDPIGRLIRTDFPNGTFSKVEFTPWQQITHDQNDTVTESDWYTARTPYGGNDPSLEAEERAQPRPRFSHCPSSKPYAALLVYQWCSPPTRGALSIGARCARRMTARCSTPTTRAGAAEGGSRAPLQLDGRDGGRSSPARERHLRLDLEPHDDHRVHVRPEDLPTVSADDHPRPRRRHAASLHYH